MLAYMLIFTLMVLSTVQSLMSVVFGKQILSYLQNHVVSVSEKENLDED